MRQAIVISLIVIFIMVVGYIFFQTQLKSEVTQSTPTPTQIKNQEEPAPAPQQVDIKASFTIITENIARNFSNPKYHNQSEDVFLQADDPSVIHVKKSSITWADFFATLPMKLTKDCLITGDGETLCNGTGGTLKFYLNNSEDPDLLDKKINDSDRLLVKYTSN